MRMYSTVRILIEHYDDDGQSSGKGFDETLTLDGYLEINPGQRRQLAVAADDVPHTFTEAPLVFVFSHNEPFKLRLADGETLLPNLRAFLAICDDVAEGALSTSLLLTSDSASPADLEIHTVEAED